MPTVAALSMFRNDLNRNLYHRLRHLLALQGVSRWVWAVGDETEGDACEAELRRFAATFPDKAVTIVRHDTGIVGSDPNTRMLRLSETFNAALDQLTPVDDYMLDHESDLESPTDVVARFLAAGKDVVGGWVTLGNMFYDSFCYRNLEHQMLGNGEPRPTELIQLESVGSCWLAPAAPFLGSTGIRCHKMAVLDLMAQLRRRGYRIWCDPTITIVQPVPLWESTGHADMEIFDYA